MKNSAGTLIAGTVSISPDNKVATFDPTVTSLTASTSYTATITTGVKDITGNAMTSAKSLVVYHRLSASDTTPPTVTSTNPASGATGFPITSSITATFSEAVQPATVTTSTYTLKNSAGTSIAGTVSISPDNKVATFDPTVTSLTASTSYTATITTGVKDTTGNAMTSAKSWSFTTAAAASSSCGNNLPISAATASGNQVTFVPTNAIDNNFNTKWWSNNGLNPWIRSDLGAQKAVCSVDIAWTDGSSRQYSFIISVSTDGNSFTNVFTGKRQRNYFVISKI